MALLWESRYAPPAILIPAVLEQESHTSHMIWSTKTIITQTKPGSSHKEMRDSCTGAVLACFGGDKGLRISPGLLREGCD